ncbi:MAG: hypothetical protein AB7R90_21570 [Reyranellaceae bacterium]
MPLRNRVTPFNDIVAVAARGTLMGNRGRLHDADGAPGRRLYTTRAWVACLLQFKNRHRPVMQPGRYTELFFLDEPTALAAGHRPCGQCRHADYRRFLAAWRAGNEAPQATLAQIDARLQEDRLDRTIRRQKRHAAAVADLPDGAMVSLPFEPGAAFLLARGKMLEWSPTGYHSCRQQPQILAVEVLTPVSTVRALAAGYRPVLHPTAEALL